jgi:hypothetical protein
MRWPFQRQRQRSEISNIVDGMLLVDEETYIDFVKKMVQHLTPNGVVMLLVAYNKMNQFMGDARWSIQAKQFDPIEREKLREKFATIESTFGELLRVYKEQKDDSPVQWRIAWLIQGLLFIRAEQIAKQKPQFHDALAEMWISMSENTMPFSDALAHNELWSDEEKEGMCFEFRKYGREDSAKWIILHNIPRVLKKNDSVNDFARKKDFWPLPRMI